MVENRLQPSEVQRTAAGVPKPDTPSMKQPNNHAMRITRILLSLLRPEKPSLIVVIAPEYLRVLSNKMAPKIIHKCRQ